MIAKTLFFLFALFGTGTCQITSTAGAITLGTGNKVGETMSETKNMFVSVTLSGTAEENDVIQVVIPGVFGDTTFSDVKTVAADAAVTASTAQAAASVLAQPAAANVAGTATSLTVTLLKGSAQDAVLKNHLGIVITKGTLDVSFCATQITVKQGTHDGSTFSALSGTKQKASDIALPEGECKQCDDAVKKPSPSTGTAVKAAGCFCGNKLAGTTDKGKICAEKDVCEVTRETKDTEKTTDTFKCTKPTSTKSNAVAASASTVALLFLASRAIF